MSENRRGNDSESLFGERGSRIARAAWMRSEKNGIPVNPQILKWARESLGLSTEDVANIFDAKTVISEVVAAWESGKMFPTYPQLETLAYKIYERPLALFFFPEPPEEEAVSAQFRSLSAEEVEKLPTKIRRLARKAKVFLLGLRELFDNVNTAPRKIFKDIEITRNSDMRSVAEEVREYLGVSVEAQIAENNGNTMLNMWRRAVENVGISVFRDDFREDAYSGFCLSDSEFPIIYLNSNMEKNRQMFTIFHEMAHILMGSGGVDFRKEVAPYRINDPTESACNRFAAEVLVPHKEFMRDIKPFSPDITAENVQYLAHRYQVSRETIWRALLTEKQVDRDRYKAEVAAVRESNKRLASQEKKDEDKGGFFYPTRLSYLSAKYADRAIARYHQGRLSAVEVSDYLNIKPRNLESFIDHYKRQGAL